MNLNDFAKLQNEQIVDHLRKGKLDFALTDPDCMDIIMEDAELKQAAADRLKEILK